MFRERERERDLQGAVHHGEVGRVRELVAVHLAGRETCNTHYCIAVCWFSKQTTGILQFVVLTHKQLLH